MYDIFISYRRKCRAEELALLLYNKLTEEGYSVSHDHSTFHESKLPFDVTIEKRVEECTDFVCIISQDTFDRCESPNYEIEKDWMVREIQYAISKKKNIIPVRLDFEDFPNNLPSIINRLSYYNGPRYFADYFDAFYQQLKDAFKTISFQTQNADALYEKALFQMEQGNQAKAIEMLLEAANNGSPGACCKLGQLYLRLNNGESWNVKYDPEKGISWLNKAYTKGYPTAYHEIGLLYLWGLHRPKEPERAVELFAQGAKLGNPDCYNELGLCFLNGIVVDQNDSNAAMCFKEGADRANGKALLNYAFCCREGRGVEKDIEAYFRYVKQAALLNEPLAHHYLACAYFTGEGTIEIPQKAFEEFEKAFKMGEIQDACNLAYCYENGYGTEQNINKAVELLSDCIIYAREKKQIDLEIDARNRLKNIREKFDINK